MLPVSSLPEKEFFLKLVLFSDSREVEVVVHIVQENRKKSFLGGY